MPDPAPRDSIHADAQVPETKPPLAATQAEPAPEAVKDEPPQPSTEPVLENTPAEPPKPEVRPEQPSEVAVPAEPPKPEFRPDEPEPQAADPVEPPKPEVRPDDPAPQAAEPIDPPKPEPRPHRPEPDIADTEKAEPPPLDPRSALRPDPSGKLPEEEVACRRRLTELGVDFSDHKAESEPAGCSMPYPLMVKSLGSGIGLQPQAEMNCAMAEAAARFAKDVISPHAQKIFREKLQSISHASAYVCRPRAGTNRLSEHAFGNALDIASFTLSGGTTIAVELAPPEKNGKFVETIRRSACGPFKTVLGPGDPDHSEHLHFDLAPRRNGGIVCE